MEISLFQFKIVAKDELFLPEYKGSTFRGSFGHALKKTVCVTDKLRCDDCLLKDKCAYPYVFETRNTRNSQVPHPFIIEPPMSRKRIFPAGEELFFNLVLIGKAIDYLPYLVYAFKEVGRRGIGKGRGRYWIRQITSGFNGEKVPIFDEKTQILSDGYERVPISSFAPEPASRVKLNFITPTALKVNGELSLQISMEILIRSIVRRLKSLSQYHNDREEAFYQIDWLNVNEVEVKQNNLEWFSWQRYSGRQDKRIKFKGFIGNLILEGQLDKLMPWLRLGELVHIGRGTVYGMGQYGVEIKE